MDDGVSIAATLYLPDGSPPAGGWPGLVFLHGLSGNRQSMNAPRRGLPLRRPALRGPHLRRAGPRRVGRPRRNRRPARDRRHACDPRLACSPFRCLGHEDRRVGDLLRRRRVFNSLAAGVPWAAVVHGGDLDRPVLRTHATGACEIGARRRPRGVDPARTAGSFARRPPGGGLRGEHRRRQALGGERRASRSSDR